MYMALYVSIWGWAMFVAWLFWADAFNTDDPIPVEPRPMREPGWCLQQARPAWMQKKAEQGMAEAMLKIEEVVVRLKEMDGWLRLPTGQMVESIRTQMVIPSSSCSPVQLNSLPSLTSIKRLQAA